MERADDAERFVEVDLGQLSAEALDGLIEEFVSRDGTDYGRSELSLEEKKADVVRQLERGEVCIVFDTEMQSANLVVRREWNASSRY